MGEYKKYSRRYKYSKKKPNGLVGFCLDQDLGIVNISAQNNSFTNNSQSGPPGHYVYIRKRKSNGICTVSTVTSLEDKTRMIKNGKMAQIRNGNIYPIPNTDSNFPLWSGVNKSTIDVHESKIQNIGRKRFKTRHHFMIGKK